jgi:hypothetical protein
MTSHRPLRLPKWQSASSCHNAQGTRPSAIFRNDLWRFCWRENSHFFCISEGYPFCTSFWKKGDFEWFLSFKERVKKSCHIAQGSRYIYIQIFIIIMISRVRPPHTPQSCAKTGASPDNSKRPNVLKRPNSLCMWQAFF